MAMKKRAKKQPKQRAKKAVPKKIAKKAAPKGRAKKAVPKKIAKKASSVAPSLLFKRISKTRFGLGPKFSRTCGFASILPPTGKLCPRPQPFFGTVDHKTSTLELQYIKL
jgi:hypothetical protein